MALGTTLSRLSTLPHDSRDSLPLKETELASFGVSWSTDLAHETELARELATARLIRHAGVTAKKTAEREALRQARMAATARWDAEDDLW